MADDSFRRCHASPNTRRRGGGRSTSRADNYLSEAASGAFRDGYYPCSLILFSTSVLSGHQMKIRVQITDQSEPLRWCFGQHTDRISYVVGQDGCPRSVSVGERDTESPYFSLVEGRYGQILPREGRHINVDAVSETNFQPRQAENLLVNHRILNVTPPRTYWCV